MMTCRPRSCRLRTSCDVRYLLGFAPLELDGKMHKLEVGLKRAGLTVRARKNYLAETRK